MWVNHFKIPLSRVFETTNHAKLLDLDLYTESKSIRSITKKKIQDIVLHFWGSTYTNNRLIHCDLWYINKIDYLHRL